MELTNTLPHLNAVFNFTAAGLLVVGRMRIARGDVEAHRRAMIAALAVSALFLVSYLAYHASSPIYFFRGQGGMRYFYYVLLISHVVLAALALPLILVTAWLGLKRIVPRHPRWARWTWPIWMYVSLTGVAVYLMLYLIEN